MIRDSDSIYTAEIAIILLVSDQSQVSPSEPWPVLHPGRQQLRVPPGLETRARLPGEDTRGLHEAQGEGRVDALAARGERDDRRRHVLLRHVKGRPISRGHPEGDQGPRVCSERGVRELPAV